MYQDWMEKIPVLDDIEINKCEYCHENFEKKVRSRMEQKEKHIKEFTVIEHFINKDFNIECGLYHITTNNNKFYITQTKDDFKAIVHCSDETKLAPIRENIIQEIRELLKKVGE